jgi:hypothetical protein
MRQAEMALTRVCVPFHLETTERNLRLIREVRTMRGVDAEWILEFEAALAQKREELTSGQPVS